MSEFLKACYDGMRDSFSEILSTRAQGPVTVSDGMRGTAKDLTSALIAAGLLMLISVLQSEDEDRAA